MNSLFFSFQASIFSQSETSEALTEICRVDPTFDVGQFLRVVQYDIIPNIFEVKTKIDFKWWLNKTLYSF